MSKNETPKLNTSTIDLKRSISSDTRVSASIDSLNENLYNLNNFLNLNKDLNAMKKENVVKNDIMKKLNLKEQWLKTNSVNNLSTLLNNSLHNLASIDSLRASKEQISFESKPDLLLETEKNSEENLMIEPIKPPRRKKLFKQEKVMDDLDLDKLLLDENFKKSLDDESYLEELDLKLTEEEEECLSKFKENETKLQNRLKKIEQKSFSETMDHIKSQMIAPKSTVQVAERDLSKFFADKKPEKLQATAKNINQKELKEIDLNKYFPGSPSVKPKFANSPIVTRKEQFLEKDIKREKHTNGTAGHLPVKKNVLDRPVPKPNVLALQTVSKQKSEDKTDDGDFDMFDQLLDGASDSIKLDEILVEPILKRKSITEDEKQFEKLINESHLLVKSPSREYSKLFEDDFKIFEFEEEPIKPVIKKVIKKVVVNGDNKPEVKKKVKKTIKKSSKAYPAKKVYTLPTPAYEKVFTDPEFDNLLKMIQKFEAEMDEPESLNIKRKSSETDISQAKNQKTCDEPINEKLNIKRKSQESIEEDSLITKVSKFGDLLEKEISSKNEMNLKNKDFERMEKKSPKHISPQNTISTEEKQSVNLERILKMSNDVKQISVTENSPQTITSSPKILRKTGAIPKKEKSPQKDNQQIIIDTDISYNSLMEKSPQKKFPLENDSCEMHIEKISEEKSPQKVVNSEYPINMFISEEMALQKVKEKSPQIIKQIEEVAYHKENSPQTIYNVKDQPIFLPTAVDAEISQNAFKEKSTQKYTTCIENSSLINESSICEKYIHEKSPQKVTTTESHTTTNKEKSPQTKYNVKDQPILLPRAIDTEISQIFFKEKSPQKYTSTICDKVSHEKSPQNFTTTEFPKTVKSPQKMEINKTEEKSPQNIIIKKSENHSIIETKDLINENQQISNMPVKKYELEYLEDIELNLSNEEEDLLKKLLEDDPNFFEKEDQEIKPFEIKKSPEKEESLEELEDDLNLTTVATRVLNKLLEDDPNFFENDYDEGYLSKLITSAEIEESCVLRKSPEEERIQFETHSASNSDLEKVIAVIRKNSSEDRFSIKSQNNETDEAYPIKPIRRHKSFSSSTSPEIPLRAIKSNISRLQSLKVKTLPQNVNYYNSSSDESPRLQSPNLSSYPVEVSKKSFLVEKIPDLIAHNDEFYDCQTEQQTEELEPITGTFSVQILKTEIAQNLLSEQLSKMAVETKPKFIEPQSFKCEIAQIVKTEQQSKIENIEKREPEKVAQIMKIEQKSLAQNLEQIYPKSIKSQISVTKQESQNNHTQNGHSIEIVEKFNANEIKPPIRRKSSRQKNELEDETNYLIEKSKMLHSRKQEFMNERMIGNNPYIKKMIEREEEKEDPDKKRKDKSMLDMFKKSPSSSKDSCIIC